MGKTLKLVTRHWRTLIVMIVSMIYIRLDVFPIVGVLYVCVFVSVSVPSAWSTFR